MAQGRVKCRICGKVCSGEEARKHKEETGHNSWELVLTKQGEV